MKKNIFTLRRAHGFTWDDMQWQHVWSLAQDNPDENAPRIDFRVSDMGDCPEDARIGRDLFDADNFIYVLNLGFHIADMGYEGIQVIDEGEVSKNE